MEGCPPSLAHGMALLRQGQAAAARPVLEAGLAAEGGSADGWNHLGAACRLLGDAAAAEAAFARALAIAPDHRGAAHNLAALRVARGDWAAAEPLLCRLLAQVPDHADGWSLLARARYGQERFAEALAAAGRAVALQPDPQALHLRGLCRRPLGDAAGAVADLEAAVAAGLGGDPDVLGNLGACLNAAERPGPAVAVLARAVALAPGWATGYYNLGNALLRLCRLTEADAAFRRAAALQPDHVDAHWNQGITAMLRGDYRRGWAEMEWRRAKSFAPRRVAAPEWPGGPLAGRSLLVHAEQGLGDTVQFLRFVPHLAGRGAVVHLAVHQPLLRLAEGFPGVASVCFLNGPLPDTDLSLPLLSLPRLLGVDPTNIPAWPYLAAAPELRAAWRERLPPGRPRIGVVWAGNPGHANDANRSLPLEALAPLLALPARFCAVARDLPDPAALERFPELCWPACAVADLSDSAALLAEMDLVITVDTLAAHLAGALGRPTWLLLPFVPDWRWLVGRDDTPWYASVRLFRQTRAGDWAEVVARVVAALQTCCLEGRGGPKAF